MDKTITVINELDAGDRVKSLVRYIVSIVFIYIACFLFIQPYKCDFPLNDDWVYSYSVEKYFETGKIQLSDWCTPNIIPQVYLGILSYKAFGHNLSILKSLTLLFSMLSAVVFLLILTELSVKNKLATVSLYIFNPILFILGFGFMSDSYYMFFSLASVYFYLIAIRKENLYYYLAGSFLAGIAYMERHLGILIPFSVLIYLFVLKRQRLNLGKIAVITIVPVVIAAIHQYWLNFVHGKTWVLQAGMSTKMSLGGLYQNTVDSLFYFGIFLLPLTMASFFMKKKEKTKKSGIFFQFSFFIIILIVVIQAISRGCMPYLENTIQRFGLGTLTIANYSLKNTYLMSNDTFWWIVTVSGGLSALYLIQKALKLTFSEGELLVLCCCSLQILVSMLRFKYFDRYLIVFVPFLLITGAKMLELDKPLQKIIVYTFILLFAGYSIIGTKDYFAWNKAKWELGRKLVQENGFKPEEVANGFDWDGYFTFQKNIDKLKAIKTAGVIGEWEWQSLNPYRTMISYKSDYPLDKLIARTEYYDWLAFFYRSIYAWKIQ